MLVYSSDSWSKYGPIILLQHKACSIKSGMSFDRSSTYSQHRGWFEAAEPEQGDGQHLAIVVHASP